MFPKIGKHPKMDGFSHGTPYFLMDDLGGKPTIFENIHIIAPENGWLEDRPLLT